MRRLFWFLILAAGLVPVTATSQSTGIAKYAGEFMASGIGGRALALGGAYTALAGDVTAAYWNPAGLMRAAYPEIGLMHEQRFGGLLSYNYGAVAWPFTSRYSLAATITRSGVDDIPDTRNALIDLNKNGKLDPGERLDYSKVTSFSAVDWVGYLTFAYQSTKDLALGVNLKVIQRSMGPNSATGVGFDIGGQYRATPELMVGATVQDVTTTLLAWDTGTNDLVSPTLKLGAAYSLAIPSINMTVIPAADVDIMGENRRYASTANLGPVSLNPRLGVEVQYAQLFAIRGGMNDLQQLTLGAGVHLPKLHLDYAFGENPMAESLAKEATHRISLRIVLEEPRFLRPSN